MCGAVQGWCVEETNLTDKYDWCGTSSAEQCLNSENHKNNADNNNY